jgi:hypothetical protein
MSGTATEPPAATSLSDDELAAIAKADLHVGKPASQPVTRTTRR